MRLTNAKAAVGVLTAVMILGALSGAPAHAQLAAGRADKDLLIMNPVPASMADSAYAVDLGVATREQISRQMRFQIRTFASNRICEVLQASGFPCDGWLEPIQVEQFASLIAEIDVFATWSLSRANGAPVASLRFVDTGRSGLAGWLTVPGTSSMNPTQFAAVITDSIEAMYVGARLARECYDRRDRQDFNGAKERARRAIAMYPNQPAAANCLSTVFEAQGAPADSVVMALEMAVAGDSLQTRLWQRIGQLYIITGDTAAAVNAFTRQLAANPADNDVRMAVVVMYKGLGEYQQALDYLQPALETYANDLTVLRVWSEICVDGQMWDCALQALDARWQADSLLRGEEQYYVGALGVAQADSNNAAMLEWSRRAVQNLPESLTMRRAWAQALRDSGQETEAVAAYREIAQRDPSDARAPLAAAQMLLEGLRVDTAIPFDTARVELIDSLLETTVARDTSTQIRQFIAAQLVRPAMPMVQQQIHIDFGLRWLEKVLQYAPETPQLTRPASFFIGLGSLFKIAPLDARILEAESCEMIEEEAALIRRGKEAITAGASVSPQSANQILNAFNQYEARLPSLRQNFCQ